jgi:hypothetical protein
MSLTILFLGVLANAGGITLLYYRQFVGGGALTVLGCSLLLLRQLFLVPGLTP